MRSREYRLGRKRNSRVGGVGERDRRRKDRSGRDRGRREGRGGGRYSNGREVGKVEGRGRRVVGRLGREGKGGRG